MSSTPAGQRSSRTCPPGANFASTGLLPTSSTFTSWQASNAVLSVNRTNIVLMGTPPAFDGGTQMPLPKFLQSSVTELSSKVPWQSGVRGWGGFTAPSDSRGLRQAGSRCAVELLVNCGIAHDRLNVLAGLGERDRLDELRRIAIRA